MGEYDAIVVGGGLAGLVTTSDFADRGKDVVILEQEGENSLGGQAFWSHGGLMMINTPEQRRIKIKDSEEWALSDRLGSAQFDREEDYWPRKFAAGEAAGFGGRGCYGYNALEGTFLGVCIFSDRQVGRAIR